eukprot:scaffold23959_cov59-Cyclotella_meneghiniana.AAC.8
MFSPTAVASGGSIDKKVLAAGRISIVEVFKDCWRVRVEFKRWQRFAEANLEMEVVKRKDPLYDIAWRKSRRIAASVGLVGPNCHRDSTLIVGYLS